MSLKNIAIPSLLGAVVACLAQHPAPAVEDLVRQSIRAIHEDWAKAPGFDFCEVDQTGKDSRTYQARAIDEIAKEEPKHNGDDCIGLRVLKLALGGPRDRLLPIHPWMTAWSWSACDQEKAAMGLMRLQEVTSI